MKETNSKMDSDKNASESTPKVNACTVQQNNTKPSHLLSVFQHLHSNKVQTNIMSNKKNKRTKQNNKITPLIISLLTYIITVLETKDTVVLDNVISNTLLVQPTQQVSSLTVQTQKR